MDLLPFGTLTGIPLSLVLIALEGYGADLELVSDFINGVHGDSILRTLLQILKLTAQSGRSLNQGAATASYFSVSLLFLALFKSRRFLTVTVAYLDFA